MAAKRKTTRRRRKKPLTPFQKRQRQSRAKRAKTASTWTRYRKKDGRFATKRGGAKSERARRYGTTNRTIRK